MSSTKGKAKRFLHKLIDSFDSSNNQHESPPKPPPKLTEGNANSATKVYIPDAELMALGLRPAGQPSFNPTRPHSTPVLSSTSKVSSGTAPSSGAQLSGSAPSKPQRSRASSTPTTPSDRTIPGPRCQCSGVTKAGKRCTRQVKSSPASVQAQKDAEDEDSPIEVFCFQHTKELLGPSGYYGRKDGKWVKFEEWIPTYLQPDTQVALRIEMEKARSQSDVPGYIYTFEIRDPDAMNTVKLKVGRAVNLVKRIDQWGKQCGTKEQVLRGWFPGTVEPDDNPGPGSLMKGRVKAGEKGSWCHRMGKLFYQPFLLSYALTPHSIERLVHLELADLAATSVYLDPAWPNIKTHPRTSTSSSATTPPKNEACEDCGSIHKEIFEFERLAGRYKGKEWESIVQPVVQRWGTFVRLYV
ncbi:hypothetical protein DXG03_002681 [Asterophora parasitica]|uniref:DUF1766-domain-containing protein n=1 Tax=Asterophora parasitica TaxID=117018 RepID=A0A9P7KCC2_9AGAR|nr:hypothetical protein DXG03_002681 [Asterophora parasitica]